MFLEKVEYYDFRKYKSTAGFAGLTVNLNKGMNLIVGENDAGKTAIIDGIKLLLGTLSDEYDKIIDTDFYTENGTEFSDTFKIVGYFKELADKEAAEFLEWISYSKEGLPVLKVTLEVKKVINSNGNVYFERKVYGGDNHSETVIDTEKRQLLKAIYLKPLRDAQRELRPGPYSRISNILSAHPKIGESGKRELLEIINDANDNVKNFFSRDDHNVVQLIMEQLKTFYDKNDLEKSKITFNVSETNIYSILSRLSLDTESVNLGLGNSNLLYIAVELLLMRNDSDYVGPRIALIEEIEAHLHPQAQIRLIKQMENNSATQFILTTHSTNLASSINPKNLIFLYKNKAFSMVHTETCLEEEDYEFLERFLDATKSNLFFAKGLIFVEGDAENLLLPAFAELIGYPLHEYGVSIVNIGNTAFERYVKLFSRKNSDRLDLPISIVTDVDIRPIQYYKDKKKQENVYMIEDQEAHKEILDLCKLEDDLTEYEDLYGVIFSTYKQLESAFGFPASEELQLETRVQKELSEDYIAVLLEVKKDAILRKFENYNANLKICVAKEWTLEYSLAKSPLVTHLYKSIFESRYKNLNSPTNKQKYDEIVNQINSERTSTRRISSELAYDIFKPLNDKNVSKAIVAQKLAINMAKLSNDEKERLKSEVLNCEYTRYLVDAIKHAAQIDESEERIYDQ